MTSVRKHRSREGLESAADSGPSDRSRPQAYSCTPRTDAGRRSRRCGAIAARSKRVRARPLDGPSAATPPTAAPPLPAENNGPLASGSRREVPETLAGLSGATSRYRSTAFNVLRLLPIARASAPLISSRTTPSRAP